MYLQNGDKFWLFGREAANVWSYKPEGEWVFAQMHIVVFVYI